jgi:hypothetical protein
LVYEDEFDYWRLFDYAVESGVLRGKNNMCTKARMGKLTLFFGGFLSKTLKGVGVEHTHTLATGVKRRVLFTI